MTFRLSQLEEIVDWRWTSRELAAVREDAQRRFFGEDGSNPAKYWPGAEGYTSRQRRFLGWFMFGFDLADGRRPGEVAAEDLYSGPALQEALGGVRGARYVLAIVRGTIPRRRVFLELEDERFELRSKTLADSVKRDTALVAHLVSSRPGVWIPGPGWIEWPVHIGPNMRRELKRFQVDPISVERLLQGRSKKPTGDQDAELPYDDTLGQAVERMTEAAKADGRAGLILSPEEWEGLVVSHLQGGGFMAFSQEILAWLGDVSSFEELNLWLAMATNIWNNTPQPDRGGKSARELSRGA